MITFVSLFLGLVLGPQAVEVAVGDGVARVELRLDGDVVATLVEPPWTTEVDFGPELAPRHFEALAYDAAGKVAGRAEQWLNLPHPPVALGLVFEPRGPGEPRVARLEWESSVGAVPEKVEATLDGVPLVVDDPRRIVLPAVNEADFHLLHVEMQFEGGVESRLDVTFGGSYGDEGGTEMTALPLVATGRRSREPSLEELQGWLEKDGEPLRVVAVEKADAEVVFVMGRAFPRFSLPGERVKVPKSLRLPDDVRVRFLSPEPTESQGVATTFRLFPVSPAYSAKTGDLYRLLTGIWRPPGDFEPALDSAVAVAGLSAYRDGRRRAVVLVPGSSGEGDPDLEPEKSRRYLERLHVPFVVWDPEPRPSADTRAWGESRSVADLDALADAFEALVEDLDRQWVVWIDGRHLPQEIRLTASAEGFELLR